jgi:hypothetical protein
VSSSESRTEARGRYPVAFRIGNPPADVELGALGVQRIAVLDVSVAGASVEVVLHFVIRLAVARVTRHAVTLGPRLDARVPWIVRAQTIIARVLVDKGAVVALEEDVVAVNTVVLLACVLEVGPVVPVHDLSHLFAAPEHALDGLLRVGAAKLRAGRVLDVHGGISDLLLRCSHLSHRGAGCHGESKSADEHGAVGARERERERES